MRKKILEGRSIKFDKRGEDPETIKKEMIDFIIAKIKTIEEIKACKSKVNNIMKEYLCSEEKEIGFQITDEQFTDLIKILDRVGILCKSTNILKSIIILSNTSPLQEVKEPPIPLLDAKKHRNK